VRVWVAGWNMPGYLPTDHPVKVDSWAEGKSFLRTELGEHFVDKIDREFQTDEETMFAYTEASAILRDVTPEHPFSLLYDGLVWWLADIPAEEVAEVNAV
jgi:hypothetical protein